MVDVAEANTWASRPRVRGIYLPGNGPYNAQTLLYGMTYDVVRPRYFDGIPLTEDVSHPTWEDWLVDAVGVLRTLPFLARDDLQLSLAWEHVATSQPDKLLGLPKHIWPHEKQRITQQTQLMDLLEQTEASELCVQSTTTTCELQDTFMPSPETHALIKRSSAIDEPFSLYSTAIMALLRTPPPMSCLFCAPI